MWHEVTIRILYIVLMHSRKAALETARLVKRDEEQKQLIPDPNSDVAHLFDYYSNKY